MIVFLNSGILGVISSPRNIGGAKGCKEWLYHLLSRSTYLVSLDICDYEVRRSLLLASLIYQTIQGIGNLDAFQQVIEFLPLTKSVIREAAQLWAEVRCQGISTAENKNLMQI